MIYREWYWRNSLSNNPMARDLSPYTLPERSYRGMVSGQSWEWLLLPHSEARQHSRWVVISEDTEVSLRGWL